MPESPPSQCPLCNGPADCRPLNPARPLRHCRQCDLIFASPETHPDPDAERERYLRHENSLDDPGYVATFDAVLELMGRRATAAGHTLDFGSGPTPVLVELLRRQGFDAVGYDPYFAPDTDLSGPFDAIVSVETFEHFARPRRELETLRARLAPGAPLIVKTLFHPGPDALDGWHYLRDHTHVSFYSAATFEWIASGFDFRLVEHDSVSIACLVAPESA
ncbi:MAG TPA: class I SAM-dependent methyltransferase [Phycisphaerae bacterium]|nr:class I SAM-dependent methyltransferase [Phycisphaerae bacterium]HRW51855.1 class I SAM-dependent methyltransferase [Phycisphaerae bacterium]